MLTKKEFAERLKSAIKENGITQAKLAEMIDTSTASISNYTKGKAFPPLDTLVELSNALGKSIDWLCCKEETGAKAAHLETVADVVRAIEQLRAINGGELAKYFSDERAMRQLLDLGKIDQSLYGRWHDGRLLDLEHVPLKSTGNNEEA